MQSILTALRNPSPLELGVWSGVVVFTVPLFLPIWSVVRVGGWCGVIDHGFIWTAALAFLHNLERVGPDRIWSYYDGDLFQLASAGVCACIAGGAAYWIRKWNMRVSRN